MTPEAKPLKKDSNANALEWKDKEIRNERFNSAINLMAAKLGYRNRYVEGVGEGGRGGWEDGGVFCWWLVDIEGLQGWGRQFSFDDLGC